METRETATCTFAHDARGFIHAVMLPGCEMALADAQENIAAMSTFADARVAVLVDMRGVRSQTREARRYFEGPEAQLVILRVALLIGSPVSRVLANFFIRASSLKIPTKLFTDEDTAVAWLRETT